MTINGREVKTVAVDFDGTLFTEDMYPHIGDPIAFMIKYVKELQDQGVELVLYTTREGQLLEDAIEACATYGLHFDYINETPPWRVEKYGESRKIGADLYIDDRSINPMNNATALMYRINSTEELRFEYYHNYYFKQSIDLAIEEDCDFIPALHVLAKTVNEYDMIARMKKYPASDFLM